MDITLRQCRSKAECSPLAGLQRKSVSCEAIDYHGEITGMRGTHLYQLPFSDMLKKRGLLSLTLVCTKTVQRQANYPSSIEVIDYHACIQRAKTDGDNFPFILGEKTYLSLRHHRDFGWQVSASDSESKKSWRTISSIEDVYRSLSQYGLTELYELIYRFIPRR